MVLIDTEEYQKLILNLMHSEEINQMIDATIYKDDERAKSAIRYGMAMASLYTCKCNCTLSQFVSQLQRSSLSRG